MTFDLDSVKLSLAQTYQNSVESSIVAGSFGVSLVVERGDTEDFVKMPWHFNDN